MPLLPHLRPLSVPKGGGGYVGYVRKALSKGYLEHPGSAGCTDDMFEIFVQHGNHLVKNGILGQIGFVRGPAFSHIGEIDPGPRLIFKPFSHRFQKAYT